MAPGRGPLFVERQSYRRRRVMDAARILPVLGFVLVLLPVLWTQGGRMGIAGQAVYLFALWVLLILAAAVLSRALSREGARTAVSPRVQPPQQPLPADPVPHDPGPADPVPPDPGPADPGPPEARP